mmetsp:Transcript_12502/g.23461  ORF Transcript_12502/g.23461 Transcript_12502/m.23461 type:complete len:553 (+) Transcript_12502:703-2361(+)
MFSPRNSQRNTTTSSRRASSSGHHHLSSTFSEASTLLVTSDAYDSMSLPLSSPKMKFDTNSEVAMDFNPFDGCWDDEIPTKNHPTSETWHFMAFESSSVPLPTSSNLPKIRLRLPKVDRNRFRVGDCEKETRSPLSSISNNFNSFKETVKVQDVRKKEGKSKRSNILQSTFKTKRPSLSITTSFGTSTTEPISDDDDSMWNEMPSQRGLTKGDHLSIKYSKRSEISDGSDLKHVTDTDISERALRPNYTHVNSAYWSERNLRPYMEDRLLLDRVGSTFAPFSSEVKGKLSIPALLHKLDQVGKTILRSPVNSDSIPSPQEAISVYAVFDGHAGSLASQFCSDWMTSYLHNNPYFQTDIPRALVSAFSSIDRDFVSTGNSDGTTACVCVVVGGMRIVCANAGDSRAIVVKRNGACVPLSTDHKPGSQRENQRIRDLGGKVTFNGRWRVEGKLAVSRAIGDLALKPYVTSTPDITDYMIKSDDLFLVIASDGIWDVLENDIVATSTISFCCKLNNEELQSDSRYLKFAAKRLCDRARDMGSADNVSVIIVDLQN